MGDAVEELRARPLTLRDVEVRTLRNPRDAELRARNLAGVLNAYWGADVWFPATWLEASGTAHGALNGETWVTWAWPDAWVAATVGAPPTYRENVVDAVVSHAGRLRGVANAADSRYREMLPAVGERAEPEKV